MLEIWKSKVLKSSKNIYNPDSIIQSFDFPKDCIGLRIIEPRFLYCFLTFDMKFELKRLIARSNPYSKIGFIIHNLKICRNRGRNYLKSDFFKSKFENKKNTKKGVRIVF